MGAVLTLEVTYFPFKKAQPGGWAGREAVTCCPPPTAHQPGLGRSWRYMRRRGSARILPPPAPTPAAPCSRAEVAAAPAAAPKAEGAEGGKEEAEPEVRVKSVRRMVRPCPCPKPLLGSSGPNATACARALARSHLPSPQLTRRPACLAPFAWSRVQRQGGGAAAR